MNYMLRHRLCVLTLILWNANALLGSAISRAGEPDGKLRIICFGAHPDDAEFKAAGVAAQWAALGHHVKFVSVTNGDIGHWQIAGGPLAQRRKAEVKQAAKVLGIESEVLDIHDGELLPTLENRRAITRLIRDWKADIVMSHRPNDYHPDHRYTGVLVQDAAFMVTVPFFCPDTPPLAANPVFFYYSDGFQKPNPFTADVIVAIDSVFDKKIEAVHSLPSQVYEGGASGSEAFMKTIPTDDAGRRAWAVENHGKRYAAVADKYRDALVKWYGSERGKAVKYAEAFEICEYGRRPSTEELKKLFPFFGR
jgi:N-acetylglucosamine malate deacetylase 1